MDAGDVHEDISRLELHIEQLANTIERCRKIILISKIAVAVGGMVILGLMLGAIRFNPVAMIGAMAVAIGGIVVFGSNTSTLKHATAEMKAAETRRAELIGRIDLRIVG
jgi:hypothetical protein